MTPPALTDEQLAILATVEASLLAAAVAAARRLGMTFPEFAARLAPQFSEAELRAAWDAAPVSSEAPTTTTP